MCKNDVERLLDNLRKGENSISPSVYDTLSVHEFANTFENYDKSVQNFLLINQKEDGSWGSSYFLLEDRLLNTLAAVIYLNKQKTRQVLSCLERAKKFCVQNVEKVTLHVRRPVASEALLPKLWIKAFESQDLPKSLRILKNKFDEKLKVLEKLDVFSRPTTLMHTLEVFETKSSTRLIDLRDASGNFGNSPAATASYFQITKDPTSKSFLESVWKQFNGGFPVNYPIEIFEINWVFYLLSLIFPQIISENHDLISVLRDNWSERRGIAWSRTFPIPDLDDTAVTFLILRKLGANPNPDVFKSFLFNGQFMCFPGETHKAVTHLAHLVEALNCIKNLDNSLKKIAIDDILSQQVEPGVWLDKWHVSPYYATSQVLMSCANNIPATVHDSCINWLIKTQRKNGGWGEKESTFEETAYAVLALGCSGNKNFDIDNAKNFFENGRNNFTEMWIDKNLYCPFNIVTAAELAAKHFLSTGMYASKN